MDKKSRPAQEVRMRIMDPKPTSVERAFLGLPRALGSFEQKRRTRSERCLRTPSTWKPSTIPRRRTSRFAFRFSLFTRALFAEEIPGGAKFLSAEPDLNPNEEELPGPPKSQCFLPLTHA